jgi:hypothetical protein
MKNSQPPGSRSSLPSFDKWVGIIVTFGLTGAFLFVFLGQQEEGWEVFRENPNPTASSGQLMPEARNSSASTAEKKLSPLGIPTDSSSPDE